ncbi:MAG: pentapeptide repeat-containing protein [Roseicyclus sp.]
MTLPNMEVRTGAILALGRIARENLSFHVQIMQILCAYVRENSPADSAVPFEAPKFVVNHKDDDLTPEDVGAYKVELNKSLKDLRARLPEPRTDIQTALDVLGRRNPEQKRKEGAWPDPGGDAPNPFDARFPEPPPWPQSATAEDHARWRTASRRFKKQAAELQSAFISARCYRLDLRKTNLQGYDMRGLDLRGALFAGAQMQGAVLFGAQMQGADLGEAQMQGALLFRAQMQEASLFRAQMQGANLGEAQMSEDTDTTDATIRGASVVFVDEMTIAHLRPHWDDIIAVLETLPEGAPGHWAQMSRPDYDRKAFLETWRAWAASLDPPVAIAPDWPL